MKKTIIPYLLLVILVLSSCSSTKPSQEEIDLVEKLYADKVWLYDESQQNITNKFKEQYFNDYQNKKYQEIYEEMMKYDPTMILDSNGNNFKINNQDK